jgi:hypothetical protein
MRYWIKKDFSKVIAVDVLMVPEHWEEISKEEFDKFRKEYNDEVQNFLKD